MNCSNNLEHGNELFLAGLIGWKLYHRLTYVDRTMFSTLPKQDVCQIPQSMTAKLIHTDLKQHSQRKRILADRYAMTNVLREKPMGAIRDRAKAFLSRVAAATASVDVYVWLQVPWTWSTD